jgi:hypothetical protein
MTNESSMSVLRFGSWVLLFAGFLPIYPVWSAKRTVQYSGVAVNDPYTSEISNMSFMTYCNLAIVNLSSSPQRVTSFDFMRYNFKRTGQSTIISFIGRYGDWSGIDSWRGTHGNNAECVGSTASLEPGEACFVRYVQETLTWGGKMGACMGRITVEDVDPTQPGSVLASGALYMNQESMVMGGQMSGAFYASQTHVFPGDFGPTAMLRDLPTNRPSGYSFAGAQNMNIFCGWACKADPGMSSLTQEECDLHCGLAPTGSGADGGWTQHTSGWSRETMGRSFYDSVREGATALPLPSVNSPVRNMNNRSESVPAGSNTNANISERLNNLDRIRFNGVANTHFAGGMVYEMQVGAYNAICSAHNQYVRDGGLEFRHTDGVDSHAVYSTNSAYPSAPPERLVCAHRHLQPDLYMRVGSSSPIVVNGGMPF